MAQYPVLYFHFTSWQTRPIEHNLDFRSPGSIQRKTNRIKYQYGLYAVMQLSELLQLRKNEFSHISTRQHKVRTRVLSIDDAMCYLLCR